jgi:hypothetical protein
MAFPLPRSIQFNLRGILAATVWCGIGFAFASAGYSPWRQFPMGCALTLVPAGNALGSLFWNSKQALFAMFCWFACWVLLAAAGLALAGY